MQPPLLTSVMTPLSGQLNPPIRSPFYKATIVGNGNSSTISTVMKDVTFNTDDTVKEDGVESTLGEVSVKLLPGPGDPGTATGAAISAKYLE